METIVSIFCDKMHWGRKLSTVVVTLFSLAVALPSSLGFGAWSHIQPMGMSFLDFFDFTSNSILMPIVAISTCVLIGWVVKPEYVVDEVKQGIGNKKFRREKLYVVMMKFIAPVLLFLIFLQAFNVFAFLK